MFCGQRAWQWTKAVKPLKHAEVRSAVLSDNGTDWIEGEPEHQPLAPADDSGLSFYSFSRLGQNFLAGTDSSDHGEGDAENPQSLPSAEQQGEHNEEFEDDASEGAIEAGTRDFSFHYAFQ